MEPFFFLLPAGLTFVFKGLYVYVRSPYQARKRIEFVQIFIGAAAAGVSTFWHLVPKVFNQQIESMLVRIVISVLLVLILLVLLRVLVRYLDIKSQYAIRRRVTYVTQTGPSSYDVHLEDTATATAAFYALSQKRRARIMCYSLTKEEAELLANEIDHLGREHATTPYAV